jgi:hypothetical protein
VWGGTIVPPGNKNNRFSASRRTPAGCGETSLFALRGQYNTPRKPMQAFFVKKNRVCPPPFSGRWQPDF